MTFLTLLNLTHLVSSPSKSKPLHQYGTHDFGESFDIFGITDWGEKSAVRAVDPKSSKNSFELILFDTIGPT